jgi:hypothetical protein
MAESNLPAEGPEWPKVIAPPLRPPFAHPPYPLAGSEIGPGPPPGLTPRGQAPLAHLLELGAGRHLLGHERRLDPLEETLEPPH